MLREILTADEKRLMDWYREEYAFGHITHPNRKTNIDEILRYWDNNKGLLYQLLGNKFMYSTEVSIEAPKEYLECELNNMMDSRDTREFYNWYRDLGWELYNEDWETREAFWAIMSHKNLMDNRVHEDSRKFKMKDGKVIQVPNGSKPMKALAKIAEHYGQTEMFEKFRLAHSRVLNTKKLEGELVISIHPMDYMTMSDNNSGWSSCMSWKEEGCYRRGTVEMMNSDCVLVAYLKGKQDMKVPGGTWNNKKWRQLFIFNGDFIAGVKPYPYYNDTLTKMVIDTLGRLAKVNLNMDFEEEIHNYDVNERLYIDDKDYMFIFETDVMYNDLENVDYTFIKLNKDICTGRHYCNYSGPANCLYCGEIEDFDYDGCDPEGLLVCCECSVSYRCALCGDSFDEEDLIEVDGHMLCEYCYENNTCETVDDNEIHLTEDVVYIHLVGSEEGIHWSNEQIKIWSLYDSSFIKEHFNIESFHWGNGRYYVTVDECKPEGLELFGFNVDFDMEEIENYKIEYSLNADDRYARRDALRHGRPWPVSSEEAFKQELEAKLALRDALNSHLGDQVVVAPTY